ncbi:Aspartyl protease [Mariniphaga anaerophila]|uniref:Aspartyl protease n=1 Tax=Mariniphaga anaerophila TaxID=1484053 RepID=A0A1M5CII8_9BACT|nr:aspartyl protease family protein [Mariniphaga anaerophila]SHF54516.1 Aspartyl protease [Mariniphaga anaerophila]
MKIKVPLQVVELEDDNFHLVVNSFFADGTSGFWVVDTGASKTVFDKNLHSFYESEESGSDQLHTAGIGDKPIETTIAYLLPFSLGKLKVKHLKAALLDLSHINKLYSKVTSLKICGLLGGDFLMHHKAVIDYKKKIMVLQTPNA